jgi:DNA repair protein RadC
MNMNQAYEKLSIKQWAVEDRPREKLMSLGIQSLTDAELLAILIGSGSRDESAVELSKRILSESQNNLHELGKKTLHEHVRLKGIGPAKAITIMAAMELGKRRKLAEAIHRDKFTSSQDVFNLFHPILCDLPYEEFWVLLLNRNNRLIERYKISQGGVSGTVIDVKIILKRALEKLASSLILCHNHPSGNRQPSDTDTNITKKLKKAAETMDIKVLDHVIVAGEEYFSLADEGMM